MVILIGGIFKTGSASSSQQKTDSINKEILHFQTSDSSENVNVSYKADHSHASNTFSNNPQYPAHKETLVPYLLLQEKSQNMGLLRILLIIATLFIIGLGILVFLLIKTIQVRQSTLKAEKLFDGILDASPSPAIVLQNYKLRYANPAFEQLTGYTKQELLQLDLWQLVEPTSITSVEDSPELKKNNFLLKGIVLLNTRSGQKKKVEFYSKNIEYKHNPAFLITVSTQEQKSAQLPQQPETKASHVSNISEPGPNLSYEINSGAFELTSQWKKMLGYTSHEIKSSKQNWTSLIHPQDRKWVMELFDQLTQGHLPSFNTKYRLLCHDGTYEYFHVAFSVHTSGSPKPLKVIGVHTKCEDKQESSQSLDETDISYKTFFSKNSAVMLITDPDSDKIKDANQAALDYYGYPKDVLLSKTLHDITAMDTKAVAEEQAKSKAENRNHLYLQHKLANGSICDVEVYSSIIQVKSLKLKYCIIFDITKRRKVEKELQKAKEMAEEANKVKTFFISNVSHEIRTPLNAIIGLTDIIVQDENLSSEQKENMQSIKYSSDHLLGVINDVLDFSKLEAGKVSLEKVDFEVHQLVKESVKTIEFKAREKGIHMDVNLEPGIPRVLIGDPSRLRQILLNLLSNAVKFTQDGHIKLDVKIEGLTQDDASLKFSVSDTGIGIPADKQSHLFESFTQAGSDTTRKFGGTGLGLSICKKLVELQKGQIGLKSIEGMGSTFWFTLNYEISKRAFLPDITKIESKLKNLSGVDVLLVEDDKMNQFVMTRILKNWHANLDIANNGREAITKLKKNKYHVVLMDLHMPELNGYEATKIIRDPESEVLDHEIPVIALTADVTAETRKRVQSAKMNDYIAKPSDQQIIFNKIMQAVSHSKTRFVEKQEQPQEKKQLAGHDYEKARLRIKKALEDIFDDDLEGTTSLISRFLKEIPRTIVGINEAFYDQDYDEVAKMVHKIKPGYSYMGFSEVSDKITKIQELAKSKTNLPKLESLCKELDDDSRNIIQILRELQKEYMTDNSLRIS